MLLFLNPWIVRIYRGDKSESEDDEDDNNEAALMKELKFLYTHKEAKPNSIVFDGRQLPKSVKGKLRTTKKSKGKKDLLKSR